MGSGQWGRASDASPSPLAGRTAHSPSPGRREGEGARRAGEGRSAGTEEPGAEPAASAPPCGAALIPLPGPSPTVRWEKGSRGCRLCKTSVTQTLSPDTSTPNTSAHRKHLHPRTVSRRASALVYPSGGRDGAPKGAVRMVAADDRPPQGVLRHPRLSAPRGNGVAWVPVLPLAVCGPARFPRLSRRRRYSLAPLFPVPNTTVAVSSAIGGWKWAVGGQQSAVGCRDGRLGGWLALTGCLGDDHGCVGRKAGSGRRG